MFFSSLNSTWITLEYTLCSGCVIDFCIRYGNQIFKNIWLLSSKRRTLQKMMLKYVTISFRYIPSVTKIKHDFLYIFIMDNDDRMNFCKPLIFASARCCILIRSSKQPTILLGIALKFSPSVTSLFPSVTI